MNPNGVIMEPGVIVVGVASLDGTKNLRFRVRESDTMKKLIETYSKMEAVVPAAIQLIFKGNPVNETDTPMNLNLSSDDVLEVCRVPGIPLHGPNDSNRPKIVKRDPEVKREKEPPLTPMNLSSSDESNTTSLMQTTKNEYITRLLTNGLGLPSNGKVSPKRPAPDSPLHSSPQPMGQQQHVVNVKSNPPSSKSNSPSISTTLKNSHLNLEMLNYPFPTSLSPNHSPLITSNNNNNQVANQTRKISELELELAQTKMKTTELARYVQFLQARLILSERASEEKELILKQKDKTIEQLRLELERREQIFRAYGIGAANNPLNNPSVIHNLDTTVHSHAGSSRKSPKSAGSSVGSNSSHRTAESLTPQQTPGPSWK